MVIRLKDLEINATNLEKGLKELMSHVRPAWKAEEIQHKSVSGGFTNQLVVCFVPSNKDDKILVRTSGEGTDKIIDRQAELNNILKLHEVGLSAPLYCEFANGLAYGYLHGKQIDENMVRDPPIYKLISSQLAKFHHVSIEGNAESVLFPVIKNMLMLIPDKMEDPVKNKRYKEKYPSIETLHKEVDEFEKLFKSLNAKVVFSHNDCLFGNIIYNQSKNSIDFIDFEYSGPNYQPYDIANHFCEFAGIEEYKPELYPDEALQRHWLRGYLETWHRLNGFGDVTDEDVEKLFRLVDDFSMAPNFMWSVWAIIQAMNSSIDFDYLQYAIERMEEFYRRKQKLMARKAAVNS